MSAVLCSTAAAWSEIKLPALFSDHMVLMRSSNVPVWGWASPGEAVTVQMGGITANTVADASGHWTLKLDLSKTPVAPSSMIVKGTNEIVVNDVLVGAVWLASGQSNMAFPMRGAIGAEEATAHSANDQIRFFHVEKAGTSSPSDDCKGNWVVASPATSGSFSAVAYFFAKRLQADLGIPVGVIENAVGGTNLEWWLSPEAMSSVKELREGEAARIQLIDDYNIKKPAFIHDFGEWLAKTGRQDSEPSEVSSYVADVVSPEGWKTIALPGAVADTPGVYWIRKEIVVTHEQAIANLDFKVMIGPLEGFERAYWNSVKVSETPYAKYPGTGYPRYFAIPRKLLRDGKNVLALRIYAPGTPPRLTAIPNNFWAGPLPLGGDWLVKAESTLPSLSSTELADMPMSPAQVSTGRASTLFNTLVAPVVPYAIDGFIWYQGENNITRAFQYRTAFSLLIRDWRSKWERGDLPFFFCQLPEGADKSKVPGESAWAELREAQSMALELPKTGEAVLIDLGESGTLHPRQKLVVGERLAQIALAQVYDKKVPYGGPVFTGIKFNHGGGEISFSNVHEGLVARPLPATYDVNSLLNATSPLIPDVRGSELQGFAICGQDRHWVWAQAKIMDKNTVRVWSDKVPDPVAVRYAWSNNPTVNLYDSEGGPAAPFRTDTFPAVTARKLYGPGI